MRSLFFYEKLGGQLQDYIKAHGYTVECPPMPFRAKPQRLHSLARWLKQQSSVQFSVQSSVQFHFILSEQTHHEFKSLFENHQHSTFTIISRAFDKFSTKEARAPLSYRLHRLFCAALSVRTDDYHNTLPSKNPEFYERFLDHCIELAENEQIQAR